MSHIIKYLGVISLLMLTACSEMTTQKILHEVDAGIIQKVDRPECEVYSAEYALDTEIIALEMESDTGINMGFDIFKKFLKLFAINFNTKKGRLVTAMSVFDPLKPSVDLVNERGGAELKKNEFKFNVEFWKIQANLSYLKQTPFSRLTSNALGNTLKHVRGTMDDLEAPWKTKIVAIPNGYEIIIPVGSFANIKVGDRFEIYNVEHIWEGQPCTSNYIMAKNTPNRAIANARVTQVSNNASVLMIESMDGTDVDTTTEGIRVGSILQIKELTDKDRRLYRSLQINYIGGASLSFDNEQDIDITPFVKGQIESVVHEYGFYIYDPKIRQGQF